MELHGSSAELRERRCELVAVAEEGNSTENVKPEARARPAGIR